MYPFVQVGLFGQSPQKWITAKIEQCQKDISEESTTLQHVDAKLAAAPKDQQRDLRSEKAFAEGRLVASRKSLETYRRLEPYVVAYLPNDPFLTIALVIGLLLLGTVVKDFFLIANNIVVARLRNKRPSISENSSIAARCGWIWPRSAKTARPT